MSARKPPPTLEEVNRRFAYDPETGIVTCKIRCGSVRKPGDIPGTTMRAALVTALTSAAGDEDRRAS